MSSLKTCRQLKHSKAQLPKTFQSGEWTVKGKEVLINLTAPLDKDGLPKVATKAGSSILDKFKKKSNCKSRKRIHLNYFK